MGEFIIDLAVMLLAEALRIDCDLQQLVQHMSVFGNQQTADKVECTFV